MKIRDRLNAESSTFGKILRTWVAYTLLLSASFTEVLQVATVIPEGWIPTWLKVSLAVGALVSRFVGSLTVKKDG